MKQYKLKEQEAKRKKEVNQQVNKSNRRRYTSVNSLANKIICANCGELYRRAVWIKRSGEKQSVWQCANRLDNGKHACNKSVTLKEKELFDQLVIINEVLSRKNNVLNDIANEQVADIQRSSGRRRTKGTLGTAQDKKRKLLKEIEELDAKLESVRQVKKHQIPNLLIKIIYPVSNLMQEGMIVS